MHHPWAHDDSNEYSSLLHMLSPLLYVALVKLMVTYVQPCPGNATMLWIRQIHNLGLSFASGVMLAMCIWTVYGDTYKRLSLDNFVCRPHRDSYVLLVYTRMFLYSKYWEWADTVFLHLGGRSISWLQYTHHMSTALLLASNMSDVILPAIAVFAGLNCFVHMPMYWYFAYPRGVLRRVLPWITGAQIVQHVLCFACAAYISVRSWTSSSCYNGTRRGDVLGVGLYCMYLVFFCVFYTHRFAKRIDASKKN